MRRDHKAALGGLRLVPITSGNTWPEDSVSHSGERSQPRCQGNVGEPPRSPKEELKLPEFSEAVCSYRVHAQWKDGPPV